MPELRAYALGGEVWGWTRGHMLPLRHIGSTWSRGHWVLGSVLAGSPGLGLLLENLRQTVEGLGCRCMSRQSHGNVPEPGSWSHLEVVGQPSSMGPARESRRAAGS